MSLNRTIFWGDQPLVAERGQISEGFVHRDGDQFYRIENYGQMEPFFMTLTSDSNHWMFLSSTGGLTAGRVNAESALFPYYTDDRITENISNTGPLTILLVTREGKTRLWKPFSRETGAIYRITSSLLKNIRGNRIIFEEVNHTLGISFSYSWMNSRRFGWVRKARLANLEEEPAEISLVDGLRNILPSGTTSQVQNTFSNLLNAYKKCELDIESGLGLFALSATLTDLAEPSESLRANTVWSCGIKPDFHLLREKQLELFSLGGSVRSEGESKGERGAYIIGSSFAFAGKEDKSWYLAADVDKDHSNVIDLKALLTSPDFNGPSVLEADIREGNERLDGILAGNDAVQCSSKMMNSVHHQANVLYNIMRGGYFFRSYTIDTADLAASLGRANVRIGGKYGKEITTLGSEVAYSVLNSFVSRQNDPDLNRIWREYLPLSFSRRHGDPSRPWNVFSIETENRDGSPRLDYQGNWRDIFQNWEALGYSYPLFISHFISKFLNATTADGYNPYRISKNGIDWEVPEPGNPWANIGYWSDHQIIYLLKLLEMERKFFGTELAEKLGDRQFAFADIPYEIKGFDEIVKNPYDTIVFNKDRHQAILERTEREGADGKLLRRRDGEIVYATMAEKLFILLLAKLGNFVPGGGIWMNTQRPEWNDANNALVGKGVSIVTLAYVRRYISFLLNLLDESGEESFRFSTDTALWLEKTDKILRQVAGGDPTVPDRREKYAVVQELGKTAETCRTKIYGREFSLTLSDVKAENLKDFLKTSLLCVDATLRTNRREDGLYHSYNTLKIGDDALEISTLYEMLEGQVAILSSGLLSPEEALEALESLERSALYREDQKSYMLYPDRELPRFMEKNIVDPSARDLKLVDLLVKEGRGELICADSFGSLHFNGDFHNVRQVRNVLEKLAKEERFASLVKEEGNSVEELFEKTFNHQSFTGRSGTFFAYEGLGSIYWHMVSKLLLAVQENLFSAVDHASSREVVDSLRKHYYAVRRGIGYNKSAAVYGAFPFEPYSHTPGGKGARQPGMTGQVKEEIITRLAETGMRIREGQIGFDGDLIDRKELYSEQQSWEVSTVSGDNLSIVLPPRSLGATFCQTPFVVHESDTPYIQVHYGDGKTERIESSVVPANISREIYNRSGKVRWIEAGCPIGL